MYLDMYSDIAVLVTLHTAASSKEKVQLEFSQQAALIFVFDVTGQDYSLTPRLPHSMAPIFTGISVPGVNFSQLEPQKHAFLQTLAVICGKSAHFRAKCVL
jgi:hypothetical protein